jgi:hypothetical protein
MIKLNEGIASIHPSMNEFDLLWRYPEDLITFQTIKAA